MEALPKIVEEVEVISNKKLCEKSGSTRIGYVKYENDGDGLFTISDSETYPYMPTYPGAYSAQIKPVKKEDGTSYPKIYLLDGERTFVLEQEQDSVSYNEGVPHLTKDLLDDGQAAKIETVESIFKDGLTEMLQINPENPVFQEMKNFYVAQIKTADDPEQ